MNTESGLPVRKPGCIMRFFGNFLQITSSKMVADTVPDFVDGTDKVDLTAFDLDSVDEITMMTGDGGVTIDLTNIGGVESCQQMSRPYRMREVF